jgi:hypothetical protein
VGLAPWGQPRSAAHTPCCLLLPAAVQRSIRQVHASTAIPHSPPHNARHHELTLTTCLPQVRREERDIISELPPKLRAGVLHHLYSETLERVPAFCGQHPAFLADLVECLRSEYYVEGGLLAGCLPARLAGWLGRSAGCRLSRGAVACCQRLRRAAGLGPLP